MNSMNAFRGFLTCERDVGRHVADDDVDCEADDGDVATATGAATRCGWRDAA